MLYHNFQTNKILSNVLFQFSNNLFFTRNIFFQHQIETSFNVFSKQTITKQREIVTQILNDEIYENI